MTTLLEKTSDTPVIKAPSEPTSTPWASPPEDVLQQLQTDVTHGLTSEEASRRLAQYGPNEIPETPPDPLWKRYWEQLTGDAVVILLLVAAIISFVLGLLSTFGLPVENTLLEAIAIFVMLNIMAGFGLWQEGQATDAARSLRKLDNPLKLVVRDGARIEVPTVSIVPGDIVYLPTGALAPADGRVLAAVNAEKDTSKLTGESLPVSIDLTVLPPTTVLNEQRNMVHRDDVIVSGNVTFVVTETGSRTAIGKIAQILSESDDTRTPLDEQLDDLGTLMTKIFIGIAVLVIVPGLLREFYLQWSNLTFWISLQILVQGFINAVALIIAAIPEGLPAVLTMTLAIASRNMVRRNALIRKPRAVEGGGSMNVLLTDKTGTLTANQMEVTHVYANGQIVETQQLNQIVSQKQADVTLQRLARIARLCNNNSGSTEAALIRWVDQAGFPSFGDITLERVVEHEFDQSLKRMSTVYSGPQEEHYHILMKGAPEQVLDLCHRIHLNGQDVPLDKQHHQAIQQAITDLASQGLRVIALADRFAADGHRLSRSEAEAELTFVGLLGIMDPPREDVAPAVATLARAGIRSVMVTGDNPITAYYVAKQVGIITQDMPFDQAVITGEELAQLANPTPAFMQRLHTVRVFARVTPEHKAEIVTAMNQAGFIVGMTGDGVNDAIALKKSDVGFAMGNGTDVAREVSDVVLMDSRFGTIPSAVEEGRNVIHRIRLYLSYILSGNGCEVGAFIAAYILGLPIPLTALVLLVINFATDSFPALAMAFEPGEQDVMEQQPRRRGVPFINRIMWIHIGVQTLVATIIIMFVYTLVLNLTQGQEMSLEMARAAAFMTYIFQKLYRAFTARSLIHNVWEIGVFRNPWTIGAVGISFSIALFCTYVPGVNEAMEMTGLGIGILLLTAVVGLAAPIAEELTKLFLKQQARKQATAS